MDPKWGACSPDFRQNVFTLCREKVFAVTASNENLKAEIAVLERAVMDGYRCQAKLLPSSDTRTVGTQVACAVCVHHDEDGSETSRTNKDLVKWEEDAAWRDREDHDRARRRVVASNSETIPDMAAQVQRALVGSQSRPRSAPSRRNKIALRRSSLSRGRL